MSIFISYRRGVSKHLARLIYNELRARGHDVFLDVSAIDSGEFDRIILDQIAAREHFLLVLSPGSLERCNTPDDWLRLEIEEAFRLKRNIVPIFDEGFRIEAEKDFLPKPIGDLIARLNAPPYSHYYFDAFIETICSRFLKQPSYSTDISATNAGSADLDNHPVVTEPAVSPHLHYPTVHETLGSPFDWIDIPEGNTSLTPGGYLIEETVFDVPAFSIAKYPVTNAHFAKFIEAGGYTQFQWWTSTAWQVKEKERWTEPRYWKDSQWNKPDYPVVAISWFEALAFCLWLRDVTGEYIMLPTEQQWQRAAQGATDAIYPWGNQFEPTKCNYNGSGTTPVDFYEGKGDSPFGVVDMSGNVWEWCLTGFDSGFQDYDSSSRHRVLRGGSWVSRKENHLRVDHRFGNPPNFWNFDRGFRITRIKNNLS